MNLLPTAGNALGYSAAILLSLIVVAWHYDSTSPIKIPDIPSLTLFGVSIGLVAMTVYKGGFIPNLIDILTPVFEMLRQWIGAPSRFNETIRYAPTDILRAVVVIPVLVYATHRDIKERIVRDWVWYPLFLFGLLFIAYDYLSGNIQFLSIWILGNALFCGIIGVILFKTRMFGGADMKAIWALALILPTYPSLGVVPRFLPPVLPDPYVFINMYGLTILANTAIIAAFWPVYTAARNIYQHDIPLNRPGLLLTAERKSLEEACQKHGKILPLWQYGGGGIASRFVGLIQSVRYGIDTQFVREYIEWHRQETGQNVESAKDITDVDVRGFLESDANKTDQGDIRWNAADEEEAQVVFERLVDVDHVWMTGGIPFILPLTLGTLAALLLGDIVYIALGLL